MREKSVKDFFKREIISLIIPIIMIVVGIIFLIRPYEVSGGLVMAIGIFLAVSAISAGIFAYIYKKPLITAFAVCILMAGVIFIAFPQFVISLILKIMGIMIIANALIRIYTEYKECGRDNMKVGLLILNIFMALLGMAVIIMPAKISAAVFMVIGIVLIVLALINIGEVIYTYRNGRPVNDGTDVVWEE